MIAHDHPPEGTCAPACPGWSEGAIELSALQRRHADMLGACQAASHVECLIVIPETPGVDLPEYLVGETSVRLNLVVGRDCSEVLLDEWGVRVALTFRGRRQDCAFPWAAVAAGILAAPLRPKPRFAVIEGGRKD